jgi:uncharacterized protein YeaO (DUF488 family)
MPATSEEVVRFHCRTAIGLAEQKGEHGGIREGSNALKPHGRPMTSSNVRLQRAYDDPQPDDGHRVLVDRVWPRGRTKAELRLDAWARDLGPSTNLRKWFGHDPARWAEFQTRYRAELADPGQAQALDALATIARSGRVTIVYGARDREHNQAQVIADEIGRRLTAAH